MAKILDKSVQTYRKCGKVGEEQKSMRMYNIKRIVILVSVAVVAIILIMFFAVFRFKNIQIDGNIEYSVEEVEELIFEKGYDRTVGYFMIKHWLGRDKEVPFIETYDVEVVSLSTIKITVYEKSIIGYLEYMGNNMYFDKDGIIVESCDKIIEGVPAVTGFSYNYIVLHEKLPVEDEKVFSRILDITQMIKKYEMAVSKIYLSKENEVSLHIGDVKVELGNDELLGEKMSVLNDIIPGLKDKKGTLEMSEYNADGNYTLKNNKNKN